MTLDDSGVTTLLRRASDGLTPDVDRLVAGGIARGRTRQRRARIGTAVASVVAFGVLGALATVVPHLGGPDSAEIARDPSPTQTTSPSPTPDPDRPPPAEELRPLIAPEAMGRAFADLAGASDVQQIEVDQSGQDQMRLYYGIVDGARVSLSIRWYNNPLVVQDGGQPLAPSHICDVGTEGGCVDLPDGSRIVAGESSGPGEFRDGSVTLATADGWQISVIAFNSAVEKEGPVVSPEPVLTIEELRAIALSDAWYA